MRDNGSISSSHATGFALAVALDRDGSISVTQFCSWWIDEERFHALDSFVKEALKDLTVVVDDQQNDLCRFKLTGPSDVLKLSNVFRLMEAARTSTILTRIPSRSRR